MDLRYLTFVHADNDFYSAQSVSPTGPEDDLTPPAWRDGASGRSQEHLPGSVRIVDEGPWRVYHTGRPVPPAGWKLHVSATPAMAAETVSIAVGCALTHDITCKHLRSVRLVRVTQAKYADPVAAGKVVTLYPPDEASLAELAERLTRDLAGRPGARVIGEIPAPGAPISARHGAFTAAWTRDDRDRPMPAIPTPQGLRPDRRGVATSAPNDVPACLAPWVEAQREEGEASRLEITEVCVVHRSNAGGVYRARWSDGRDVVLKEARRHTGYDQHGVDAVTRLRHEERALVRLAGTGLAPERVAYIETSISDFLVMTHLPGPTAAAVLATRHPDAAAGTDAAAYDAWLARFAGAARTSVAALHARGVVHRDLQPANLVDLDVVVAFLDFESCAIDGVAVSEGVATPLSDPGGLVDPVVDDRALTQTLAILEVPEYVVVGVRQDLADDVRGSRRGDDTVDDEADSDATRLLADRLVAGIHLAATPFGCERDFPGDIAAFGIPGAAAGLLHGTAGVLRALTESARPVPEAWVDALVDRVGSDGTWRGLGHGIDGVAAVLGHLGRADDALRLLRRGDGVGTPTSPWWEFGAAGTAVAAAELAVLLRDDSCAALARRDAQVAATAVRAPLDPPGYRPGLLSGWSGIALGLLRVSELLGDDGTWRAAATDAVRREARAVIDSGGALMAQHEGRLVPYLGVGTAALGLAAAALAARGDDDPQWRRLMNGLAVGARLRSVVMPGVLTGRSGLLAALRVVAPQDPVVREHVRPFAWFTVPAERTRVGAGTPPGAASFLLGDQLLRCSLDLATGSAGAVTAVLGTLPATLFLPALIEP